MKSKKILMLLDNSYKPDPRVKKEGILLSSLGYDIDLFCWDKECLLLEEEINDSMHIHRIRIKSGKQLGAKQFLFLFKFYISLFKRVKNVKGGYDIIYVHDFLMLIPGVFLKFIYSAKLIFDAHEIYHIMEWEKYNSIIRFFLKYTEVIALKFVNSLIVVNEIRLQYYKKFKKENLYVIGNWYSEYVGEKINVKKDLGINENDLVFGYFGTLSKKSRDLEYMINSVDEDERFNLVIAGSGGDEEWVDQVAKKHPRIHFIGWLDNIRVLIDSVDYIFYILNPDRQYFQYSAPNTLYISISHSVPLITNVPGEAKDVLNSERIGCFIDSSEPLKDQIINNVIDPQYISMKNNMKRICSKYDWTNVREIFVKLLGDINE